MKNAFIAPLLFLAGLLALGMQGCASVDGKSGSRTPASSLTNTYWKLISLDGKPVTAEKDQRAAHLILQEKDNRLAGSGGCNRIMGSYRLDGSSLSFGKVASTMMACGNMHDEQAFLATLEKIKRWKIEGDRLDLLDESGQSRVRFEAVALP
jgi:heat shock protein HslJ